MPDPPAEPGFVFLSYARDDGDYVDRLVGFLRDAGLEVWKDDQIPTGTRWQEVLSVKIDQCAAVVVVMSPSAGQSPWVDLEIERAKIRHKAILPLLLDGEVFFSLANLQYEPVLNDTMPTRQFVARVRDVVSSKDSVNYGRRGLRPGPSRVFRYPHPWVVALVTLLVGVLAYVGISSYSASAPGTPSTEPLAPDPFLYVAVGDALLVGRKQPCDGLFGLCMGQSISMAIQAFGPTEADGFPYGNGDGRCHGWQPKRLDRVTICEIRGSIVSIRLDSFTETNVLIAAPHGLTLRLPDPLGYVGELVSGALQEKPFTSVYVPGEGESVFSFDWYLSAPVDGPPESRLSIVARKAGFPEREPTPCPGRQDVHYPYQTILAMTEDARITSVEVALMTYNDVGLPPPTTCG